MILKMTDRTEMFVSPEEGAAIRRSLTKSDQGFITVRGITLKKTAVLKLEDGGVDPRATIFNTPEERKLIATSGCRGEKSIHKAIIKIANDSKQFKKLADPKWRAEQEKILRASGQKFCDPKNGECACTPA